MPSNKGSLPQQEKAAVFSAWPNSIVLDGMPTLAYIEWGWKSTLFFYCPMTFSVFGDPEVQSSETKYIYIT